MDNFLTKSLEKYLTSLLKNTFVAPNVNFLKCICKLSGIESLGSVILVLLSEILTTNIDLLLLSSRNLLLLKVWLQVKWLKCKLKSLPKNKRVREREKIERKKKKILYKLKRKMRNNKLRRKNKLPLTLTKWILEVRNFRSLELISKVKFNP